MRESEIRNKCKEWDQEHLLQFYAELSENEQEELLSQIQETDFSILTSLGDETISQRGEIAPIDAVSLEEIQTKKEEFRELGLEEIRKGHVGAVLLAGGMGTRLGSSHPKGMFNIGETRTVYIFQRLIENMMEVVNEAEVFIPLFIMTSEKNHEETCSFFKEHDFFGYPEQKVYFFRQKMAPATDWDGKILLEKKNRLATSPNGNGGWFSSMADAGLLQELDRIGIEWLNVFAVDNVLQKIADPVFIGAVKKAGMVSGSKVVAKAEPTERVGVLCLEDGKPSIVEYYELSEEMTYALDKNGKLLYNYGVILNYLFRVDTLKDIMNQHLPVHVVKKKIPYIDKNGTCVSPEEPNGYKFEELVLDMIHMMDNCLAFEVERDREFAPVKNATGKDSVDSARELLKKNGIEI